MKKILVTGNSGSGKTTLSKQVAEQTGIPRRGLDSIVWKSGWKKASDVEKRQKIRSILQADQWIVDGVSEQAFVAADTIFFLDLPLYQCILNILKRFLQNGFGERQDLPPGCPEYIGVFKALKVAIKYPRQTRPWLVDLIKAHPEKKITWVRDRNEFVNAAD